MNKNIYEHKSLTKLIFIFGIPSILSLMIEMLTGIVDTAFAGNLPQIGDSALSAMALISPLLGIFTAFQTLFAMSTGMLVARYLNDAKRQRRSYTTGIIMSIVTAFITSGICFLALTNILLALGADGEILKLAKQYLQIQLLSNIFSSLGYTLTCCIRAFGFPKTEVIIVSCAVLVNITFNFLFTYLFKLGISGLAWATLTSEAVCMICAIIFLIKKKLWLKNEALSFTEFLKSAYELFKIGIAQTAMQVLGGCTGFVINSRLIALGTMAHVAAYNIVQRIYTFILVPIVGLTQGVQNIISYFMGNDAKEKIKAVSKRTMLLCGSYGFVALIMMIFFGQNLASVFGGSAEILLITKIIIFIVFLGFPFIGILYTDMTLLQVTGHEFSSILLILSRQIFFLIPLVYIIPAVSTLINGEIQPIISLFFCMPIADILSVTFAFILKKKFLNKSL